MPLREHHPAAQLHHGERLTRYVWASRMIAGLEVLDVSWGAAHGTDVLASGHPQSLTSVRLEYPDADQTAHLQPKPVFRAEDGRRLNLRESSQDAVIALEVIEHAESPAMLVSELYRAMRPDGFVVMSSSGHAHNSDGRAGQLDSDQLERLLRVWFRNCRLHRQRMWITSLISQGAMVGVGEDAVIAGGSFPGLCAHAGQQAVTIAVASNRALPDTTSIALLLDGYRPAGPGSPYLELQEEVAQALEELQAIRSREAHATRRVRDMRAALSDIRAQISSLLDVEG